ncbi:ATP-binding protein [Ruminococcaceae bacterium OttesenSCG-928-A16]|nr:ATP-binding protein [Ruminococcaceae bacterium OttesenSCG-928-A16]
MDNTQTLALVKTRLHCLALFRGLLTQDESLAAFLALLDALDKTDVESTANLYCAFVAALYKHGGDFGAHLLNLVLQTETPALQLQIQGKPLPQPMADSLASELETFSLVSSLKPAQLAALVGNAPFLPRWQNSPANFDEHYHQRLQQGSTKGYGIFAAHHMFVLGQNTTLLPVKNPDPQRLAGLTGYAGERAQILTNTKALLNGLPANNILLYGDAGTGKSSTVKALANEYYQSGLRLIEVRKNQLYQIPALMDMLAENPLKFILFIDDLSFPADDGNFTELKAILEGNIAARPGNMVVYATSNRRHMVTERFSSRQGDDLHQSDTREEEASLAARFGLTITFLRPDKDLYIEIVQNLAAEMNLQTPMPTLLAGAEAHAIRHGGRSPRTARQFVEYMKAVEQEA